MGEKFFKHIESKVTNTYNTGVSFEGKKLGDLTLKIDQALFKFPDGKIIYGKIPKELQAKIDTLYKGTKFSPNVDFKSKDGEAILMNVRCFKGAHRGGEHVEEKDFVIKVENGQMSFAEAANFSYSNNPIKTIALTKDHVLYDTEGQNLYEKEFEDFEKTIGEMRKNPMTSKEIIEDFEKRKKEGNTEEEKLLKNLWLVKLTFENSPTK